MMDARRRIGKLERSLREQQTASDDALRDLQFAQQQLEQRLASTEMEVEHLEGAVEANVQSQHSRRKRTASQQCRQILIQRIKGRAGLRVYIWRSKMQSEAMAQQAMQWQSELVSSWWQ